MVPSLATVAFISLLAIQYIFIKVLLDRSVVIRPDTSLRALGYLEVPNRLFLHFYKAPRPTGVTSFEDPLYLEALGRCLAATTDSSFQLDPSSLSVRKRLSRAINHVGNESRKMKGRRKTRFLDGTYKFTICDGETVNIKSLEARISELETDLSASKDEVEAWKAKYGDRLKETMADLYEEMRNLILQELNEQRKSSTCGNASERVEPSANTMDIERTVADIEEQKRKFEEEMASARDELEQKKKENEEKAKNLMEGATTFHTAMEKMSDRAREVMAMGNRGGKLEEVGIRQRQRKLKEVKENTQKAMWFAKTFGLIPQSLKFLMESGDQEVEVTFNKEGEAINIRNSARGNQRSSAFRGPAPGGDNRSNVDRFNALPESEKDMVMQTLYLFDHFSGSDALYHELSMMYKDMPRSYLVWAHRQQLNGAFNIQPLQGPHEGAYMSLTDLVAADLCRIMNGRGTENPEGQKFSIKISGDGARFSKSSSFTIMSYAVLETEKEVLSSTGHRAFAVLKGGEDYDLLKDSLHMVWADINNIIDTKHILINGSPVNVDIYFCGDYKFLLSAMGLNSACSHYLRLWCDVHKDDIGEVNFCEDYYEEEGRKRTLTKMKENF